MRNALFVWSASGHELHRQRNLLWLRRGAPEIVARADVVIFTSRILEGLRGGSGLFEPQRHVG